MPKNVSSAGWMAWACDEDNISQPQDGWQETNNIRNCLPLVLCETWSFLFLFVFSQKHNVLSYKSIIFAMSILIPKAPMGRGRADIYIIRRNCTLWFWLVRTSQTLWIVKNKATETPHVVYRIQPLLASDGYTARCHKGELYTYTNVGLSALYQRCT